MLVNIIQNTISSFISAGISVITTNLKMWLGFETSETLGREEVVNGDFSDGTTDWIPNDWTISNNVAASGNTTSLLQQTNVFKNLTGVYKSTFKARSVNGTNVTLRLYDGGSPYKTFTITSSNFEDFTLIRKLDGTNTILSFLNQSNAEIEISNVSVKELTQITPDKSNNNNVGELFTGKAIELDGLNDEIDFGTAQIPIKTISFWIKPLSVSNEGLFYLGLSSFPQFRQIAITSGNISATSYFTNFTPYVNNIQTSAVTQDVWQRVVLTFDEWTTTTLQIGKVYSSVYGHFAISDVQFYNETWSADDIAYDYANPNKLAIDNPSTSLSVTNLKAYWALSEGAGSLVYDSSGEGNNGTINGATYIDAQPRIPQLGMQNWSKGSNLFPYSEDFTEWVISPTTSQVVLAPTEAAPYGQGDVYSIIMQASESDAYIRYATTNATLTSSTHSVWVKQAPTGSATHIRITTNNKAFWNTGTSQKIALTSSWQRLETTDAITGNRFTIIGSADASGTQDSDCIGKALIYGAQLLEGSSAGVYRFTDGVATSNSTVIANPTIPTQDIFGNLVRDRLNSFNLDGSGYAEVADADDLDFGTGAFSCDGWVKFKHVNTSSINCIYTNGGQIDVANNFGIGVSSNKIVTRVSSTNLDSTTTFSDNVWVYFALTRDNLGACKLYINGNTTPEATATDLDSVSNSLSKQIGRDSSSVRHYNDLISDVRVYSKALSSTEIENNYNAGLSAHTN